MNWTARMGSTTVLAVNHLLTDMWRHASAEGLSVYSFLDKHTTLPRGPNNFQLPHIW